MLSSLVKKIIGSKNDRQLKRMGKKVKQIGDLENELQGLSDEELKTRSLKLKERAQGGESLDDLLVEAFAVCRETSQRVMGMRHFDVQLIGAMTLHEGRIAEMRTGEGKTLMATLAVYLNALSGKGVHVVTVNEYLARRDAAWMQPLYDALGLTVGVIVPQQDPAEKHAAYNSDITYGTNNEFGFDYLRDNMAFRLEDKFQRELNFAVVDEVDSILIDEARTPLIISGPAEDSSELYMVMNKLAPRLERQHEELEEGQEATGHYIVDEKTRQVELTEAGHQFVEDMLTAEGMLPEGESLYASQNLNLLHHAQAALKAHTLFQKNVEYIVSGREIMLVDEHTGRTMPGRRLSEGLHQALEAKEGLPIQAESQTLASTTFQNYFRLYDNLSGMTGTADTEAYEFRQIYGLDVVVIPTHKDMQRKDMNDLVYLTIEEKYEAIIQDIRETVAAGRPVLVGTASIDSSEMLSNALNKAGIEHQVLNAKFHEKEAEIIAQAGKPGAITIATNMAGRGTDIILGGNWEAEAAQLENPTEEQLENLRSEQRQRHDNVLAAGGLHIIGTERHESRRIDNQLRGRAGRQGDAGSSRFYLSLEDNLMRIFASDRVKNFMKALGMEKGEAIEHRMVTNAIEKAQRKVEGRNFDIRKNLLEYDDVANDQRKVVYTQRNDLLSADDVSDSVDNIREEVINTVIDEFIPPQSMAEQWDINGLEKRIAAELNEQLPIKHWLDTEDALEEEGLRRRILEKVTTSYREKEELAGAESLRAFEKHILLRILDDKWKEHLATMDHLRQGIHLRGYAAKNPKQEYKREAFELFSQMLDDIKHEVIRVLSHVQVQQDDQTEELERQRREELARRMQFEHQEAQAQLAGEESEGEPAAQEPMVRDGRKVGRNEPCPCGSGKKFKQCHGKIV
ncbi:preprotein translocase subunit SecA [Parendozoicomonas haliclonae]|uniref:Protein translocase subunit SecA n=1 Tax=Parendozoicomonas haliclonae TaxID=1960125 RepID=A0A1X7AEF5_9GAMM|nr:preprotein translocase subunit SecA [Parendozoicomonas haliclonae]SMA34336.1 preprotein translocase subunit SecA [Parendozoicomonas haliclonae]